MEFAISCPARPDVWKDLAVAEDHGFTQAWFYDSQMIYSDRSRRRKNSGRSSSLEREDGDGASGEIVARGDNLQLAAADLRGHLRILRQSLGDQHRIFTD